MIIILINVAVSGCWFRAPDYVGRGRTGRRMTKPVKFNLRDTGCDSAKETMSFY